MGKGWMAAAACVLGMLPLPLSAATADGAPRHVRTPGPHVFAQDVEPVRRRRAPTQLTVRPRIIVRPAPATGIYPSPLPYNYPGPNAVRDCESHLVLEHRPSGDVLFPRMHCWWTRQ